MFIDEYDNGTHGEDGLMTRDRIIEVEMFDYTDDGPDTNIAPAPPVTGDEDFFYEPQAQGVSSMIGTFCLFGFMTGCAGFAAGYYVAAAEAAQMVLGGLK